jgi:hypothetical protein
MLCRSLGSRASGHQQQHCCRRATQKALTKSSQAEEAIDGNIHELSVLVNKQSGQESLRGADLYEAILQSCDKLRLKLLPRARSLQLLRSSAMVRNW